MSSSINSNSQPSLQDFSTLAQSVDGNSRIIIKDGEAKARGTNWFSKVFYNLTHSKEEIQARNKTATAEFKALLEAKHSKLPDEITTLLNRSIEEGKPLKARTINQIINQTNQIDANYRENIDTALGIIATSKDFNMVATQALEWLLNELGAYGLNEKIEACVEIFSRLTDSSNPNQAIFKDVISKKYDQLINISEGGCKNISTYSSENNPDGISSSFPTAKTSAIFFKHIDDIVIPELDLLAKEAKEMAMMDYADFVKNALEECAISDDPFSQVVFYDRLKTIVADYEGLDQSVQKTFTKAFAVAVTSIAQEADRDELLQSATTAFLDFANFGNILGKEVDNIETFNTLFNLASRYMQDNLPDLLEIVTKQIEASNLDSKTQILDKLKIMEMDLSIQKLVGTPSTEDTSSRPSQVDRTVTQSIPPSANPEGHAIRPGDAQTSALFSFSIQYGANSLVEDIQELLTLPNINSVVNTLKDKIGTFVDNLGITEDPISQIMFISKMKTLINNNRALNQDIATELIKIMDAFSRSITENTSEDKILDNLKTIFADFAKHGETLGTNVDNRDAIGLILEEAIKYVSFDKIDGIFADLRTQVTNSTLTDKQSLFEFLTNNKGRYDKIITAGQQANTLNASISTPLDSNKLFQVFSAVNADSFDKIVMDNIFKQHFAELLARDFSTDNIMTYFNNYANSIRALPNTPVKHAALNQITRFMNVQRAALGQDNPVQHAEIHKLADGQKLLGTAVDFSEINGETFTQKSNTCFIISSLRSLASKDLGKDWLSQRMSFDGSQYHVQLSHNGEQFVVDIDPENLGLHDDGRRPQEINVLECAIAQFMQAKGIDDGYYFGEMGVSDDVFYLLGLELVAGERDDETTESRLEDFVSTYAAAPNTFTTFRSNAHWVSFLGVDGNTINVGDSLSPSSKQTKNATDEQVVSINNTVSTFRIPDSSI